MADLKNSKIMVSIDPETLKEIESYAADNGLKSANMLLTAVSNELAKAKKKHLNIWHVLGRIAADDDDAEPRKRVRSAPALELTSR